VPSPNAFITFNIDYDIRAVTPLGFPRGRHPTTSFNHERIGKCDNGAVTSHEILLSITVSPADTEPILTKLKHEDLDALPTFLCKQQQWGCEGEWDPHPKRQRCRAENVISCVRTMAAKLMSALYSWAKLKMALITTTATMAQPSAAMPSPGFRK